VIARLVGHHSVSMDFVDHFRGDESDFDYGWEERWIRDEGYSKIVPPAIKGALAACKLKGADITHFIMPILMPAFCEPPMSEANRFCSIESAVPMTPAFWRSLKGCVVEAK
jgi:hypothetical protein